MAGRDESTDDGADRKTPLLQNDEWSVGPVFLKINK